VKRDRLFQVAALMAPLSMMILLGVERLTGADTGFKSAIRIAGAEVLAFVLPFLLLCVFARLDQASFPKRLGGFSLKALPTALYLSVFAALFCFLLNCLMALVMGDKVYQDMSYLESMKGQSRFVIILAAAVLPAVSEEMLFRGGILGAMESCGTYAAVFVSALTFAMVHGTAGNFVGPFAAGLIYGGMTYALGSIWPAVFAHFINNLFSIGIAYLADAYQSLGIWPYFLIIAVFLMWIFLYLSMRSLEKLLGKGKIPRFKTVGFQKASAAVVFMPGLWMLTLLFIFRAIYH